MFDFPAGFSPDGIDGGFPVLLGEESAYFESDTVGISWEQEIDIEDPRGDTSDGGALTTFADHTEERFRSAYFGPQESIEYYVTSDRAFRSSESQPSRQFIDSYDDNVAEDSDVAFTSTTNAQYSKRDGFDVQFFEQLLGGLTYELTDVSESAATYTADLAENEDANIWGIDVIGGDLEPAVTTPRARPAAQFPDGNPVRREPLFMTLRSGFITGEIDITIGPDAVPTIDIDVVTEGEQRRFEHTSTHEFQRNIPPVLAPAWVPE